MSTTTSPNLEQMTTADPYTVYRARIMRGAVAETTTFGPFDTVERARYYARGYGDALADLVTKDGYEIWHNGTRLGGS